MFDLQRDAHVRVAAVLVVGVGAVSTLARVLASGDAAYPAMYERKARTLVRQATQLGQVSQQDADPAVALQHATQAMTYLEIALQLVDATTLQRGAEVDVHVLGDRLRKRQSSCLSSILRQTAPPKSQAGAA
jgi:hypothetical protein